MSSIKNIIRYTRIIISVIVLIVVTNQVYSQSPVGGVKGTVTDSTGAAIIGTTISLTQVGTSINRSAVTDADGSYRFSSLIPGEYEIKVQKHGFNTTAKRVIVNVGLTGTLDFSLSVGAMAESVSVVAETPIIDTDDNAIKAQITSDNIKRLPLNGRNFLDLAFIAPGAVPVRGETFDPTKMGYTGVSIGGQAGRNTRIALDGGDVNDETVGTTTQNFSPEIIQEFQISTSSYDVSTGASSSGAVNIVTRTGQNDLHGSGYLYYRDAGFAAFPGLKKIPDSDGVVRKPPFDREQYGGTLGGKILRDRLFFFANVEKNNQDQQEFVSTGLADGNPFDGVVPAPFDELYSNIRLDARLKDNHNLFARWSRNDNAQITGNGIGKAPSWCTTLCTSSAGAQTNLANQIVTGLTSSFGSRYVNEARFNFSTFGNRISPIGTGPAIFIRFTNFTSGTNLNYPQSTFQNRYQLKDDFTIQGGRNIFKTGAAWNRTNFFGAFQNWSPAGIQLHDPVSAGRTFPTSEAEFKSWEVRTIIVGVGDPNLPVQTPGGKTVKDQISFYGDNSMKINRRLTLNFGVNYRYDSNLVNHDLAKPAILSKVLNGNVGATTPDKNNLGGRFGLAWDVRGNSNTVIRAGYGLYYDSIVDNLRVLERGNLAAAGSGYVSFGRGTYSYATFPRGGLNNFSVADKYTLADALRDVNGIRSSLTVTPDPKTTNLEAHETGFIFDPDFQTPYSNQINIGLQQKLPFGMVFTSDFLYRLTLREFVQVDVNQANSFSGPVDDRFGPIDVFKSIGKSKYVAGNFRVEKRFSKGYGFTATYVLSKFKAFDPDALGVQGGTYNVFNLT